MSPITKALEEIQALREQIFAAGLTPPGIPPRLSYIGGAQYLRDLESFRTFTLEPLVKRIGQPPMQPPKLTRATVKPRLMRDKEFAGFAFEFPQYPGITWAVYKDALWRVVEHSTGLSAGRAIEKTRAAAIAAQWDVLEGMRVAPKHAGSHASVITYVQACIAHETRTPAP